MKIKLPQPSYQCTCNYKELPVNHFNHELLSAAHFIKSNTFTAFTTGSLQTRPNMSGFQGAHLYLQGDVFLGVQSFISAAARHTNTHTHDAMSQLCNNEMKKLGSNKHISIRPHANRFMWRNSLKPCFQSVTDSEIQPEAKPEGKLTDQVKR